MKTVFRFDSGKKGFEFVAIFLVTLAGALAVFGIIWIVLFLT